MAPVTRDAVVPDVTRPISQDAVPAPSQPVIAAAPSIEQIPVADEPAAVLTLPEEIANVVEPAEDLDITTLATPVEIAPTVVLPVIEEVQVVSAPVVTPTIALPIPKSVTVKPTPDSKPRDVVQELTFGTVAALRARPAATVAPSQTVKSEDTAVFQFILDARASGRTDDALDALINAAHQTRELTVPAKFLMPDGLVDTAAIFEAMTVPE